MYIKFNDINFTLKAKKILNYLKIYFLYIINCVKV